jgi:RNA polymerase sigma-70 factor (TIGR02943 family)
MTSQPVNPDDWLEKYGDLLFRYAIVRVNDQTVAEDLVQETFLSALKAYSNFKKKSTLGTWLVSILKHKIIDHYRSSQRKDEINISPPEDAFQENGFWDLQKAPRDWGDHPEKAIEQQEFQKILQLCFSYLPERMAQILSMRSFDGVESDKICKILNISLSNLWVLLHRARAQLRRCLEENWFSL